MPTRGFSSVHPVRGRRHSRVISAAILRRINLHAALRLLRIPVARPSGSASSFTRSRLGRIHKTSFAPVKYNRRAAGRFGARRHRPRNPRRCRGRRQLILYHLATRLVFHLPSCIALRRHCPRHATRGHREHSLRKIQRRFPASIQRMSRHNRRSTIRGPHPHAGDWPPPPDSGTSLYASWTPHPAHSRLKQPSAVVIGQPPPRIPAEKGPAKKWIVIPRTIIKWRPSQPHSKWPPAASITSHRKPRSIRVQIAVPGNVARAIGQRQ